MDLEDEKKEASEQVFDDIEPEIEEDFEDLDNEGTDVDDNTDAATDVLELPEEVDDDEEFEYPEEDENKNIPRKQRRTKITVPKLSVYEKTKILAYRAQQIMNNAVPCVDVTKMTTPLTPYNIAIEELKQKVIPFKVVRELPDNTFEVWSITDFYFL